MCQWTTDSQRLILEHFDVICGSPSYIYCFALPICPPSSWLHQYYSAESSQETWVVKGVSAEWGTCFCTVSLDGHGLALTCWKDTIAVGLESNSILILNAITGIQMAILSGHIGGAVSLVFSPDGASLVSGSHDWTIKLWDMQTGGVIKTLQGHTAAVFSTSISADFSTIASGSCDKTIRLWDTQTGECHCIIEQKDFVGHVSFFPLDPKHLMSVSGGKIQQWDIGGQKIVSEYDGSYISFSPDGTQFAVCNRSIVEVRSSGSKGIVAKLPIPSGYLGRCHFSPDGRVIAVVINATIYIWDITNSNPHLVDTLIGHTIDVSSLAFSSFSLISTSQDESVRFWQIGASSAELVLANPKSAPPTLAPIKSVTLQAKDGIVISSHSDGVVRTWDISTGLCNGSFQTPAKDLYWMDSHLTDGRLIFVWHTDEKIYIWDTKKGKLLRTVDAVCLPGDNDDDGDADNDHDVRDLRISEDGSQVFCLYDYSVQAWSIWTGEFVGKGEFHGATFEDPFLTIDTQGVWVYPISPGLILGWDFGILDLYPVELSGTSRRGPHLDFIGGIRMQKSFLPGIQDTVTGKVVLQLPARLATCSDAQWDGQYLVAGYNSGEVLILECNCVPH